jgi:hypothetical protein
MASKPLSAPASVIIPTGVTDTQMRNDLGPGSSADSVYNQLGGSLATGVVTFIDYETLRVSIRTVTGEEFTKLPFALTFPGAGARRFFGAMPEIGDMCIIGFMATSGVQKIPVILGYYVGGTAAGHDWWPTQPFGTDEFPFTNKARELFAGIVDRQRHKLRHMRPGEVVASSSQGSDLVLNEGVLLTNRRGNEIRLRDQDQAFLVRAVVEFHALAGARVYAGTVQRDARLLPSSVVSDGMVYDTGRLLDAEGRPIPVTASTTRNIATQSPSGTYMPNPVFSAGIGMGTSDPSAVLRNGLIIDESGFVDRTPAVAKATYGGKQLFRVAMASGLPGVANSAVDSDLPTLAEYRVEVAHTTDGTLPVTEQTDGFDADRLPQTDPRQAALPATTRSPNAAFVEQVLGTVVGNDPYSVRGVAQYGLPLRPVVFDGAEANPSMASAIGTPIGDHAATMLRVTPPYPLDPTLQQTWWSVTKDGRVRATVAGPVGANSAEVAFQNGVRMSMGVSAGSRSLDIDAGGLVRLHSQRGDDTSNVGVEVSSDAGAVRIFAGGNETSSGPIQRMAPTGGGEGSSPGLTLEAKQNILIKAGKSVTISAVELNIRDNGRLKLNANDAVDISSTGKVGTTAKVVAVTSTGKTTNTFSGPTDSLPTNGALRETTFAGTPLTGFVGGVADQYTMVYGDRLETIALGNDTTLIGTGNITKATTTGSFTASGTGNSVVLGPGGAAVIAATGAASLTAVAGTAFITGVSSVSIASIGPTSIRGASVTLSATGGKVGPIVSGADLDPLTGLPLITFGMGSPTHLLSA